MLAMCFFGITSTCTGACGWMSRKASTASFSNTVSGLIWPLPILQKRQSLLMHPSSFAHVSAHYEPLTARKKHVGPVEKREATAAHKNTQTLHSITCARNRYR